MIDSTRLCFLKKPTGLGGPSNGRQRVSRVSRIGIINKVELNEGAPQVYLFKAPGDVVECSGPYDGDRSISRHQLQQFPDRLDMRVSVVLL